MDNERNAELMIINDETDGAMIAKLTTATEQFCSMVPTTPQEQIILFNAMNAPEHRLRDVVNVPLQIVDVYAEIVECINEETGEASKCPRIVLIDKDGNGYQAVSKGVFNALRKLFQVYGLPHWDTPVVIVPKTITKGARNILTFNIGDSGKKSK